MLEERPGDAKHPLSRIDANASSRMHQQNLKVLRIRWLEDEIAIVKAEIDEKYYLLGKTICEIADKEAGTIGALVDRLVELKKEHMAQATDRREENECEQSEQSEQSEE